MGIDGFNKGLYTYSVNENFFDTWTSQMAYVLGFAYADGNIYKTSLSWDIQKRDKNILTKIKQVMDCTYPIVNRPNSVRLRMNNRILLLGAASRGLIELKAKRMELPKIPREFVRHFVRGFLDGDGWLVKRNNRNEVDLGFVSGNKVFLENLSVLIFKNIGVQRRVREKNKITSKGFKSTTYLVEYYSNNAVKVADWLYDRLQPDDIYLERKYKKYLKIKKLSDYLQSGTKKVREIQSHLNKSLKEILDGYYLQKDWMVSL